MFALCALAQLAVGRNDGSVTVFDKDKALGGFFVPVAELSDSSKPIRSVSFGTGGRFLGEKQLCKLFRVWKSLLL